MHTTNQKEIHYKGAGIKIIKKCQYSEIILGCILHRQRFWKTSTLHPSLWSNSTGKGIYGMQKKLYRFIILCVKAEDISDTETKTVTPVEGCSTYTFHKILQAGRDVLKSVHTNCSTMVRLRRLPSTVGDSTTFYGQPVSIFGYLYIFSFQTPSLFDNVIKKLPFTDAENSWSCLHSFSFTFYFSCLPQQRTKFEILLIMSTSQLLLIKVLHIINERHLA